MTKTAWIVLIVAVLLVVIFVGASLLVPALTGVPDIRRWGFMGPGMMGGWGWPLIGGIGMILFWALMIGGVVWLAQALTREAKTGAPKDEPLMQILERRYAKGEITKDQFEQMKRDLGL